VREEGAAFLFINSIIMLFFVTEIFSVYCIEGPTGPSGGVAEARNQLRIEFCTSRIVHKQNSSCFAGNFLCSVSAPCLAGVVDISCC
jgi:hypothetical protein